MAAPRIVRDRGNPLANAAVLAWESLVHPLSSTQFVVEEDHGLDFELPGSPTLTSLGVVATGLVAPKPAAPKPAAPKNTPPPKPSPGPKSPPLTGASFKIVFAFVAVATFVAGVAYVWLAMTLPGDPTKTQASALDFAKSIAEGGFGAAVGLLGGKVTK